MSDFDVKEKEDRVNLIVNWHWIRKPFYDISV